MLGEDQIFDMMRQALWIAARMSMPLLAVALLVGVVIGLFQALTSIQEATLTFVPKIAAMMAVFWVSMSFMTTVLSSFWTDQIIPLIGGR